MMEMNHIKWGFVETSVCICPYYDFFLSFYILEFEPNHKDTFLVFKHFVIPVKNVN